MVTLGIKPGLHRLQLHELDSLTVIKLTNVLQNKLVVEYFDKIIFGKEKLKKDPYIPSTLTAHFK